MVAPLNSGGQLAPADRPALDYSRAVARWIDGRTYPVGQWRKYLLVFFAATLSCTVMLKIAEIQYLELIFAFDLLVFAAFLLLDRPRIAIFKPFLHIAQGYGIFLVCAFLLSLLALRNGFYYSAGSLLKSPVMVTISRMAELILDVFYTLYLASLLREDERLCIFAGRTYLWTGVAGCLYSIATFPLNIFFQAQLGTYSDIHRFRGMDNEGGSFGVYLLSTLVLTPFLYRQKWISKKQFQFAMVVLTVGLIGSQSKAAVFALAAIGCLGLVLFLNGWRRLVFLAGVLAALSVVTSLVDLPGKIDVYRQASESYATVSNLRPFDGNFVSGRVAGAVMAPRMIATHPLIGIGWGNYPLVRDNPDYRQGTAFLIDPGDAPGLGVVDYIIDLGIPLWIYLTALLLLPLFMLRARKADPWLVLLAFILPVSNWVGTHLNLIHPWIVLAFALGVAYRPGNSGTTTPAR